MVAVPHRFVPSDPGAHRIWSPHPAERWTEAYPLGNGRLGAMVYGRPGRELIRLNHETAWSGSPASNTRAPVVSPEKAAAALEGARAALLVGDHAAAERHLADLQHRFAQTYLPLADLTLDVAVGTVGLGVETDSLRRELDLSTAVHTAVYRSGGGDVRVRAFVSRPAQSLIIAVDAEDDRPVTVTAQLTSQLRSASMATEVDEAGLRLRMPSDIGRDIESWTHMIEYEGGPALSGVVLARPISAGAAPPTVSGRGDLMTVTGRGTVVIAVAATTTFRGIGVPPSGDEEAAAAEARAVVESVDGMPLDDLIDAHIADHQRLYARTELRAPRPAALPTDGESPRDRLLAAAGRPGGVPAHAPELLPLLFHYGRYLLIASSYGAGLPATLQGIWNAEMLPPWSSKYTTNINVEMNYWGAETANLAECSEPLFDLIYALERSGREVARDLYGAPGWVTHHNTDAWAFARPEGLGQHPPRWSFWPMAGPWLVRHLVERLDFGADREFAAERIWPVLRSAAEFYVHWAQIRDGVVETVPSTSPENEFIASGGRFSAGISSTMDLSLMAELFAAVERVATLLDVRDDEVAKRARALLERIPCPTPGADGLVREWSADPVQAEPGHRHLSHLYFAYPGQTPDDAVLRRAVSASLDDRGDDSTGWSLVWKLALRARLGQREKVDDLLELVFRPASDDAMGEQGGLYPNFFAAHPPFQIDGNLGYVGAFVESLLQSHGGVVELLPALPSALPSGAVRGLVARPGVEVDLEWSECQLRRAVFRAARDSEVVVRYGGRTINQTLEAGRAWVLTADG